MRRSDKKLEPKTNRERALETAIVLKEKGSLEWCYQKVAFLRDVFQMEQLTIQQWENALDEIKQYRAWEKIPEEQPYGSLDALLKGEVGVESEEDGINTIRQRRMKAAANTDGNILPPHRPQKVGNSPLKSQVERAKTNGIDRKTQRKLDRLAEKAPEICRLIAEGQLTVAAAERAAGITKEKTPLQRVQTAWKHATLDDKRLIVSWIQDRLREDPELLESLG